MSGFTTISGAQLEAQFVSAALSGSQALALQQLFATNPTFSLLPSGGVSNASGAVFVPPGTTSGTITGASYVISDADNAKLTVTSGKAEVFGALGDTITATGSDTLFGADSGPGGFGATSFISTGANSSIVGGTGDIAATASGANTTLIGGTGNSNFTVSGANSLAVGGYAGMTAVTLTDTGTVPGSGAEIATNPLPGASGTLVATLSSTGADSVIGGGGSSTITGGGGDDVFGFVNGYAGGNETILDFTSKDTFAFGGYNYSMTNPPPETVVGGSDVITLSDGTTITLVGIDHKVF